VLLTTLEYISNRLGNLFLLGGCLWKDHEWCDQLTTVELQYFLKFQVLTDVSVVHLPDWTRGHQPDHILLSTLKGTTGHPPWTFHLRTFPTESYSPNISPSENTRLRTFPPTIFDDCDVWNYLAIVVYLLTTYLSKVTFRYDRSCLCCYYY